MTAFLPAPIHRSTRIGWDGIWDEAQHRSLSSPSAGKALPAPTPRWDVPGEAKALQPRGTTGLARWWSPGCSGLREAVSPLG